MIASGGESLRDAGGGAVLGLFCVGLGFLGTGGLDHEVTDEGLVDVLHRGGVPDLHGFLVGVERALGGLSGGQGGERGVAVAAADHEIREVCLAGDESEVVRLGGMG
jgi:hypothetical protein